MQSAFEQFLPLALLMFGGKAPGGGSFPSSTPATGMTSAIEVPRVKTGGDDQTAWAVSRYQMLLGMIKASGNGFDDD